MRTTRCLMAVVSTALAAACIGVAIPAHAATTTIVVQAGAKDPDNPSAPYEYTTYYPRGADGSSTITVHRNDVVQWMRPGFHSITFLTGSSPVWIRADEIPGTMAVNEQWLDGSACGHTGEDACVVDAATGFLSSGAPIFDTSDFRARIDRPAGTTVLYHCVVHPTMHGSIRVVSNTVALPSQATIDAQIAREVREDTAKADALFTTAAASRPDENGHRIWTIRVGATTPDRTVSVAAYFGRNADGTTPLRIDANDTVEFVVNGLEPHTVTFPSETIGDRVNNPPLPPVPYGTGGLRATIRCDLDDPATGAVGVPFPPAATSGCPVGTRELALNRWMTDPQGGNTVYAHGQYVDSGFMLAADNALSVRSRPGDPSTWPSQFTATFPTAGAFTFGCNLHNPFMVSSIEVV